MFAAHRVRCKVLRCDLMVDKFEHFFCVASTPNKKYCVCCHVLGREELTRFHITFGVFFLCLCAQIILSATRTIPLSTAAAMNNVPHYLALVFD